jgi:uncharacterized protein
MKAVLALIVIYVGTFLVAIQGASNSSVEASEQSAAPAAPAKSIDPAKEADIRSLLELVGARDSIQDSASTATEQYRQKLVDASANSDRSPALVNAYLTEFQRKFDANAVNEQLVQIYDRHFTDEEIRGLLEFYGSPLGQKVAAELPKISREVQFAIRSAGNQAARQAWQDLRREGAVLGAQQENGPSAGDSHPFAARRRGMNANAQSQPQQPPVANQQAAVDPQP